MSWFLSISKSLDWVGLSPKTGPTYTRLDSLIFAGTRCRECGYSSLLKTAVLSKAGSVKGGAWWGDFLVIDDSHEPETSQLIRQNLLSIFSSDNQNQQKRKCFGFDPSTLCWLILYTIIKRTLWLRGMMPNMAVMADHWALRPVRCLFAHFPNVTIHNRRTGITGCYRTALWHKAVNLQISAILRLPSTPIVIHLWCNLITTRRAANAPEQRVLSDRRFVFASIFYLTFTQGKEVPLLSQNVQHNYLTFKLIFFCINVKNACIVISLCI